MCDQQDRTSAREEGAAGQGRWGTGEKFQVEKSTGAASPARHTVTADTALDIEHKGVYLRKAKHAQRRHVLARLQRQEAHKRNLARKRGWAARKKRWAARKKGG